MNAHIALTSRPAATADVPFIAMVEEMASTPPFTESMWAKVIDATQTPLQQFLIAMYAERASRWGAVEDFVIVERLGEPVAACAVYRPEPDAADRSSFRMDRLEAVAAALGWTPRRQDAFRAAYDEAWRDAAGFLEPVADVIIETVGVIPAARGTGAGKALMKAAFARGRSLGAATIGVSVVTGNDGGRRLYDSVGFRPVITFHPAAFGDAFPGFTKLRRSLADADHAVA